MASEAFLNAVASRRSHYKLNKTSPISDEKLKSIIDSTVLTVPSAFNSQSTRLLVLLNDDHDAFWDIVGAALKQFARNADAAAATAAKIAGFRAGYGTILFYEDQVPLDVLKQVFKLYADKFPQWSEHTSAMHQFVLWTALELEGFGANLQHYNPIVDGQVAEKWNVPESWNLIGQLVFGGKVDNQPLSKKAQNSEISEKVLVHGAQKSNL